MRSGDQGDKAIHIERSAGLNTRRVRGDAHRRVAVDDRIVGDCDGGLGDLARALPVLGLLSATVKVRVPTNVLTSIRGTVNGLLELSPAFQWSMPVVGVVTLVVP